MSDTFLQQLQLSGHLVEARSAAYREREQQSLARLQRLRPRTYLQEYDLLFRYVSRWLLNRGYELTGKQPHHVLARVCELFMQGPQVQEVIRCRHAMKYHASMPSPQSIDALSALIQALCIKP